MVEMSQTSKKLRFEIFKRDRFTCQYCGQRPPDVMLEIDHIIPKVEGGPDAAENLTTACFDCNRGKGARSLGQTAPVVDEQEVLASIQTMLERKTLLEKQMRVADAQKGLLDSTVGWFLDRWEEAFEVCDVVQIASIKKFLEHLDVEDLANALASTEALLDRYPSKTQYALFRYFCGACWKKIRDREAAECT